MKNISFPQRNSGFLRETIISTLEEMEITNDSESENRRREKCNGNLSAPAAQDRITRQTLYNRWKIQLTFNIYLFFTMVRDDKTNNN